MPTWAQTTSPATRAAIEIILGLLWRWTATHADIIQQVQSLLLLLF